MSIRDSLRSSDWWFSVVIVGVLVGLLTTLLYRLIERKVGRASARRREARLASIARQQAFEDRWVEVLSHDQMEQIAAIAEASAFRAVEPLIGIVLGVGSGLASFILLVNVPFPWLALALLIALVSVGFILTVAVRSFRSRASQIERVLERAGVVWDPERAAVRADTEADHRAASS